MSTIKFESIINAVCYWLGYQAKIGRQKFIHEASIRYPIADAITAENIPIKRIELEYSHLIFERKRIDLVVLNENEDTAQYVFEFKIAKYETAQNSEQQRVFDDIVRLAYCHKYKNTDSYFLICGTYEDFNTYFVKGIANNKILAPKTISDSAPTEKWDSSDNRLYGDWFDFGIGHSKTIVLKEDNTHFLDFRNNYTAKQDYSHENSITIKTTCIAITPANHQNQHYVAGIWKIECISISQDSY